MPRRRFPQAVWLSMAAGTLAAATPAYAREGALHALYVGIADYQHGEAERAPLIDLEGAPNDIAAIRTALESRAAFESVTVLRDAEAGRTAILASLEAFATGTKGAPGETLVFYYTGHGARAVDMSGTQVTSFHSTLVPWDARSPALRRAGLSGDILDIELRDRIDAITARGVNVVTIFDSCNSGTATRNDGRAKSAAEMPLPAVLPRRTFAAGEGVQGMPRGYRVHLAGAVDNSEAFEHRDAAGVWRSDFTAALAAAISNAPANASYRELFDRAKAAIDALDKGQRPRTEGAVLTPFLAARPTSDRLFSVTADGPAGRLTLGGGSLSLVGQGARFALYQTLAAANAADAAPLAIATVTGVTEASAALDVALSGSSGVMVARELAMSPAAAPLTFVAADPEDLSALTRAALAERPNLVAKADGAYRLVPVTARLETRDAAKVIKTGDLDILRRDGSRVAQVPSGGAAAEALSRIARYDALLALSGRGSGLDLQPTFAAARCDGSDAISFAHDGTVARAKVGEPVRLRVTNPLSDPLYIYVLYLDADYSIALLDPAPFSEPVAWPGGACAPWKITPDKPGRHRILMLASTEPLPGASTLDQASLTELGAATDQVAHGGASRSAAHPAWAVRSLEVIVE